MEGGEQMNIRANAGTSVLAYAEWGLAAVGKVLIVYAAFDLAIGIAGYLLNRRDRR